MANSAARGTGQLPSPPEREIDVLRQALAGLKADLPKSWRLQVEENARRRDVAFGAIVTLRAPDGQKALLVAEAKRLIATRDVSAALEQIRSKKKRAGLSTALPLLIARYLSPTTRERLEQEGVAFADATGNRRIAIERPALFVRNVGQDRDPWRGPGRPRGTLKGSAAARVVRALVDFAPPYTLPELVKRSGASTGATYRVVEFLEEEQLLARETRGPISAVHWRRLLERWSQDYSFRVSEPLLFPRGVEALPELLRSANDLRYVVTGSLAARHLAPHAAPRFAMIHADDLEALVGRLKQRRVDQGANVLVSVSRDHVAFIRSRLVKGVNTTAPSQTAVDLLTGPGRSPSEGEALLDWMEANERQWRA
jgi:hypothetical protein